MGGTVLPDGLQGMTDSLLRGTEGVIEWYAASGAAQWLMRAWLTHTWFECIGGANRSVITHLQQELQEQRGVDAPGYMICLSTAPDVHGSVVLLYA